MTTKKLGRQTVALAHPPSVAGHANVVGKKEGEGPLADSFDQINQDDSFGEKTWEKAETAMQKLALSSALDKAGLSAYKVGSCTGNSVRVRSGPGLNYSIKRKLNKGNLFRIICILPSGWVQVDVEGNWGYVSREYVQVQ